MKLWLRRIIGNITKPLTFYGTCGRCNRHWGICEYHVTHFSSSEGCFPLCEECWQELTPETRLPYYRELWEQRGTSSVERWEKIKKAVLEEK